MKNKDFGYIHFPASELKNILEFKASGLSQISTKYKNKETEKGKSYCSINIRMLNDFLVNDKKEKEWIELIAFLSIRSILGRSKYKLTNNKHILSRMLGVDKYSDLAKVNLSIEQNKLIIKYTKLDFNGTRNVCPHKMKRLFNKLELDWRVLTYSRYTRGLFISIDGKCSLDELVEACERRREKNRVKELQEKKNNAYFSYKLSLNNIKTNNEFG
jgi:hypothetical protein